MKKFRNEYNILSNQKCDLDNKTTTMFKFFFLMLNLMPKNIKNVKAKYRPICSYKIFGTKKFIKNCIFVLKKYIKNSRLH